MTALEAEIERLRVFAETDDVEDALYKRHAELATQLVHDRDGMPAIAKLELNIIRLILGQDEALQHCDGQRRRALALESKNAKLVEALRETVDLAYSFRKAVINTPMLAEQDRSALVTEIDRVIALAEGKGS